MARNPITVFVSHSALDKKYLGETALKQIFDGVEKDGDVEVFWDDKIEPGSDYRAVTKAKLNACSIGLLLLSPSFFSSHFIKTFELPVLKRRFAAGTVKIIPVYVSECRIPDGWLKSLQYIPHEGSLETMKRSAAVTQRVLARIKVKLEEDIRGARLRRLQDALASSEPVYLRRRCRVIPDPSNGLKAFMNLLLVNEHHAAQRPKVLRHPDKLKSAFEATMAKAMLFESMGKIPDMLKELNSIQLKGSEEACRRLYRGIAQEKLSRVHRNNINLAITDNRWILEQTDSTAPRTLKTAARFNLSVCAEKQEAYDEVHFDEFMADGSKLPSGESIWHKAIVMEMIVCQKTGKHFDYEDKVQRAMSQQRAVDPSGWAKTLITWHRYHKTQPTDREIKDISKLQATMPTSARAAVICELAKDLVVAGRYGVFKRLTDILEQLYLRSGDATMTRYLVSLGMLPRSSVSGSTGK